MERGELTGKVAIVTGSATGIGSAAAIGLARHGAQVIVNYSKSHAEADKTADTILTNGGKALVVQGDVASRRRLPEDRRRSDKNVGTDRHPRQQCGHDEIRGPRKPRSADGARFHVDLRGERRRTVPDDPRGGAGLESERPRRGRQRLLGRGHRGRGLVGRLCGFERRAQHDDPFACPRAGAGNPRQCGVPGLCRDALVHRPFRSGDDRTHQQGPGRTPRRSSVQACRKTSPMQSCSSACPCRGTSPAISCRSTPACICRWPEDDNRDDNQRR